MSHRRESKNKMIFFLSSGCLYHISMTSYIKHALNYITICENADTKIDPDTLQKLAEIDKDILKIQENTAKLVQKELERGVDPEVVRKALADAEAAAQDARRRYEEDNDMKGCYHRVRLLQHERKLLLRKEMMDTLYNLV